ncbi:zinc-finger homeodomain protein 5-like [Carica papaya]|uniref:zinc-finger homeodomain protein 5-like n=1 Tax=Carica papaya TaxID=3649 RepID=UPI000B8CB050|nr:zinc-finger homeodomain protein 5-like [Carica papaya]
MEFRGEEGDIRVAGSSSPSGERRRDGNQNGITTTILTSIQTIDHTPSHSHRQLDRNITSKISSISVGSNPAKPSTVRYRECLKNHAANVGGNVYDGCGEFMPSGDDGSIEALKCAACDCHRNFHRKEVDGETTQLGSSSNSRRNLILNPLQLPPPLPSPTMLHHHQKYPMHTATPMSVAFGGGAESSSEDLNPEGVVQPFPPPFGLSKKRFRTKFSQEQKEKMLEFAEKVGWRINKQDEEQVERFCAEVGIKRQVFKVWMHNNKNNTVKKQPEDG